MTPSAFDPASDELIIAKPRKEIVFIESDIADIGTLINGIGRGKEIVILDATQDGLHQIAQALAGKSGIDAVHIMSHGEAGAAHLGSLILNSANLDAYKDDLQTIRQGMSVDGDILLYGCRIGADGDAGFVQQLAIATGADVAASSDTTGSAAFGGNWELEVVSGQVETAPVIDAQTAALYHDVLSINPGVVSFSNMARAGGSGFNPLDAATKMAASSDIIYSVNGYANYQLKIDGKSSGVVGYTGSPGAFFSAVSDQAPETELAFSFVGGQLFTASRISLANYNNFTHETENLIIRGYDASGNPVGAPVNYTLAYDYVPKSIDLTSALGSTPIKTLKIKTADGAFKYLMIDSISISSVALPPPNAPSAPDLSTASDSGVSSSDNLTNIKTGLVFTGTTEAGVTSLKLYEGATEIPSTSSITGTTYTITTTSALADGVHTLTAKAFNAGGTASAASGSLNVTVDTQAPTVSITADKTTLKAGETAAITFAFSEDPGATFTWSGSAGDVSLNGGTLSAISGSGTTRTATFTPTANTNGGSASISVSGGAFADAAGNVNASASGPAITYDTLAPNAPSAPDLGAGSDSGISNTDNLTNIKTGLVFTGTTEAGVTSLKLYEGATEIPSTSSISGTTYTITTTSALADGVHALTVKAFDAAGNASAASGNLNVTVDTVAPTASITVDATQTLKAGDSAHYTFHFSEDPGASFTLSDIDYSGGPPSNVTGTGLDRDVLYVPPANAGGTASISVAANRYSDAAGNFNTASSSSPSITYDTLAPNAPSAPNLSTASDSGRSNTDDITNIDTGLVFTGTTEAGVTSLKLYDTDGTTEIASTSSISGTTYTITTTGTLASGAHTLTVKAFDAAGNQSPASGNLSLVVDTTPPTTTVSSAALSSDTGDSTTDMITRIDSQTISGTLSANLAAGERVLVSLDNGATWNPAIASAGTNTWSLNATLSGSNTLKVKVEDLAGNGGTVYAHAYVIDQAPPAAPSTPDLDAASDSGASSTDNVTGVTAPSFSGTAQIGSTVRLFDGGIEIGSAVVADGTWHITTGNGVTMGERIHYITAQASDIAGNVATSAALEVDVRTTAPGTTIASMALSADSGAAGDFITNASSQTISGLLSANLAAGERVQVSLDGGGSWNNASATVGSKAWSIAATLAAGTHDIKVRVTDPIDNSGPVHTQAYTLDSASPTVAITSSVPSLAVGETATIRFTFSDDPGTSFSWDGSAGDITVSGGTLSALSGTGPVREATFTPNANTDAGSASIQVVNASYQDAAGNNGTASNILALTYDTRAPNAPSAPVLAAGDDSGASNSDGVTNDTTLSFSGTAEAGATVRLYDGATLIGSATATGGVYTIPVVGLAEGNHSLTAVAVDAVGNTGAASAALTLVVDGTPPSTTVAGAALSSDTGASTTDMITRIDSQTISGTLSANLAAGERILVSLDNGATWNPAIASAGTNTWSLNATLSGSNTLKVKVEDLAGNGGTVYAHAYVIDQVPPVAPSTPDLDAASDSGASNTDNVTGVTAPSFSGTAEIGSTVRLFDGGIEIGSAVVVDGTWHITTGNGVTMDQRIHYITAQASDIAGNVTGSAALEVDVRTTAPATAIASMALSADSGAAGDFITNASSQTISGLLSANLAAGERVQVSLDGGTSWNNASATAGSKAWSIAAALAAGTHDIKVRVTDPVDNSGPVYTQAYTLDGVKPAVLVTSSASTLKAGETATMTFTFSKDPGTSFGDSDITVSGGTLSALSGTGTVRTAVFTPDAGANGGTASIAVKADSYEDLAGNLGAAAASPSISFDTLAPAASSAPDLDQGSDKGVSDTDNLTNLSSLAFKGTAEAGATVRLYDSNGTTEIGSGTASGGNWTIAASALGEGSHTITAKVTDAAGNVSAVSGATTVVVDTTKPTLVIGSDVSQLKIGDTAAITFTFSEDPGTGFTDADITVSGGSLSAIQGAGTVRTATFTPAANTNGGTAGISVSAGAYQDAAGNDGMAGTVVSMHFDTLAPATPPAPALRFDNGISDSDNIVTDATLGFQGTAEDLTTIKLYDADSGVLLFSSVAFGGKWQTPLLAPMPEGPHSFYVTATDAAGNVSAPSAITTVTIDTIAPPNVTIGSDVSKVKIGETATITFTFSADPGADFSLANVSANGAGTFGPLSGTGLTRTAVFTPYPDHEADQTQIQIVGYRDAAGNPGTSAPLSLLVDTRAPAALSAPVLSAGSDTGSSSSDRITSDTKLVFSGAKELNSTVTLYDSDGSVLGSVHELIGAWSIESATLSEGTHTITATQTDVAGNVSILSSAITVIVDTHAAAPAAPVLHSSSDSAAAGDGLTSDTTPTITGSAEANALVTLYDSDGSTVLGTATADAGGAWSITSSELSAGVHDLRVRQVDAAGNASAASPVLSLQIDNVAPALAAPTLALVSDSGVPGDGISKVAMPIFSGSAEALAQVTLYDGATAIGSVKAGADGAWQLKATALLDGVHAISATQTDLAGNVSDAGAVFSLTVDTVAPAAPAAPLLKASSDTGTIGDGITLNDLPVIEGTALANSLVTLYDSAGPSRVKVGTAMSDGAGKWSIATTGMSTGTHTLSVTQSDAAGNESASSAGFTLRIDEPPQPVTLIDGVPVSIQPISLPGGVIGSAVSIPLVGAGRTESSGQAGVADIALSTSSQGAAVLLAQLGVGYGLSASGASVPVANAAELLLASIKAATPAHAASDQGHLTGNGQSFLAGLASAGSLLVETIKPVSSAAPEGLLTLTGSAPGAGQSTALVIDAGSLAPGATLALQQVDFAAVIGAANVVARSSMVLSGDGASQHFTVAAGGSGSVFAGGGNDVLSVAAVQAAGPAPAAGTTLLHGGAASDAATFSGVRADYNIEVHNGYVIVSSKSAPALKAMVVNVEQLQFSDISVAVQNSPDIGTLTGMYQTVLGRQADVMGIEYWANIHQAGASWGAIALSMIASTEHVANHEGFNGVAAHDVALLYTAIFNRNADAEGLAYWTGAMGRGMSLEQVASGFVQSAEMVGHQRAAIDWDFIAG